MDTPIGRIGANICFDALIPESARLLAVQNVEIVPFPFAADAPQGWSAWAGPALRARCQENGVFGIACNYSGRAAAAGLSEQTAGELLIHELKSDDLRAARAEPEYRFRFRRPELYGPLAR